MRKQLMEMIICKQYIVEFKEDVFLGSVFFQKVSKFKKAVLPGGKTAAEKPQIKMQILPV